MQDREREMHIPRSRLPMGCPEDMPGCDYLCENAPEDGYPILHLSDRLLQMLGWTGEQIGERFHNRYAELLHPEDRAGMDSGERVCRLCGRNGYHWVAGTAGEIIVGGRPCLHGTLVEISDFMEREQSHMRRLEAENRAKTTFLFNMSHDIRTLMNAIVGFTELLKKHVDDREKTLDYIEKIQNSNGFLLSLINNVLEMARIESGKESLNETGCNVRRMIEALYALFEPQMNEKGIRWIHAVEVQHEDVLLDETKVREILMNIMSNAIKYTLCGGTIGMILTELPCDRPGYALYRTVIEDTGIGMSREFLPQLFEEFSRERASAVREVTGTGLGMPIVKKLVDLMDGTIEVESELGKGTRFTLTLLHRLDEAAGNGAEKRVSPEREIAELAGKRILLAEDNELNAEIIITILQEEGLLAERAEDGAVCVDMLQRAEAGYYDAILMDVQMPRLDGYRATQMIRRLPQREKANIPIIAMTANAFEEDRRDAFRAGMNAHLAKPIQMDTLNRTLSDVLTRSSPDASGGQQLKEN